ncbi:hypothetical protein BC834DRAFT_104253 [Gloeopeniophorella convolvens]|nr:hypothetical protein BC834DRAFT_104253 [Gloeopeniophorella convolvens]
MLTADEAKLFQVDSISRFVRSLHVTLFIPLFASLSQHNQSRRHACPPVSTALIHPPIVVYGPARPLARVSSSARGASHHAPPSRRLRQTAHYCGRGTGVALRVGRQWANFSLTCSRVRAPGVRGLVFFRRESLRRGHRAPTSAGLSYSVLKFCSCSHLLQFMSTNHCAC